MASPRNLLTDVPGLRVGHAHDPQARTGVTVILPDIPCVGAVDVRGGGPGTRETDALACDTLVEAVDALVLRRDLNTASPEPYDRIDDAAPSGRRSGAVDRLEKLCMEKGMRMTEQRRVIARVLSGAEDHPDVEELHRRAHAVDPHISIATVYRTVRLFEESGILTRHDFRDGRSRYEEARDTHHDHLIDMKSGRVVEFVDDEIEALQKAIAKRLGFKLVDHRLELYGVPADD